MPFGAIGAAIAGSAVSGLFNKSSAKDQMDFQAEMSNTSYRRQMEDMKAAGLNPMLAAKIGGASTPVGAGWSMPDLGQSFTNAYSAETARESAESQIDVNAETQKKIQKEAMKIAQDTQLSEQQTKATVLGMEKILAEIKRIEAETNFKKALTTIPQLVKDLVDAIRNLGGIASPQALQERIEDGVRIVIRKDASDYEAEDKPWFHWEWNKERQLK